MTLNVFNNDEEEYGMLNLPTMQRGHNQVTFNIPSLPSSSSSSFSPPERKKPNQGSAPASPLSHSNSSNNNNNDEHNAEPSQPLHHDTNIINELNEEEESPAISSQPTIIPTNTIIKNTDPLPSNFITPMITITLAPDLIDVS